MTNPADVLTDEFIERVTKTLISRVFYQRDPHEWRGLGGTKLEDVIERDLRAVLREERDPIHRVTYEIRAKTRVEAFVKLREAVRRNEDGLLRDVRLIDEKDEP